MGIRQSSLRNSIPEVDAIRQAIIETLKSGRGKSFEGIENDAAKILGLTQEQKRYRIGTSKTALFSNRVNKARSKLYKEGFIEYPRKGKARLTKAGKAALIVVEKTDLTTASSADNLPGNTYEAIGIKEVKQDKKSKKEQSGTDALEGGSGQKTSQESVREDDRVKKQNASSAGPLPKNTNNQGVLNKKEEKNLLSLVLAIIGLALSLTTTWFAGLVLIGIALVLLFKQQKTDNKTLVTPKITIGVSILGILLAFSSCTGALTTDQKEETGDSDSNPPPVVEVEEQQGVLSFELALEEWTAGDGKVTVEIVCTEGDGLGFKDSREVTPGKKYKVNDKAGHYVFTASVKPFAGNETIYTEEKKSYQFSGEKDHTFTLKASIDEVATEEAAVKRAEAERAAQEAEEQRQREEEAAAEAAAAAAAAEAERQAQSNESIVYITNTGAKYHSGSCRHLAKSKIEITKSNAIARGYEPCKNCSPG